MAAGMAVIGRRLVLFVEGYDPQGAQGYYDLFRRSWKRFLDIWACQGRLGTLALDDEVFAHWDIEASGPNWRVSTRYEFLRLEGVLRANLAEPMWRQVPRALAWAASDLVTGTTARIFRLSWRFALHLLFFQLVLLAWLALAIACGVIASATGSHFGGLPGWAAVLLGVAAAMIGFVALRPLAERLHVVQIINCWPHLARLARGESSTLDAAVEAAAARVAAAARAGATEEIVVIGHSAAGVTAPAVMARALELDPDIGRHGPRVVLLTLGSVMPGAALHPAAVKLRAVVRRLATEPSLTWIDCQSRKDVMNFWDIDPVDEIGVEAGAGRCNPLVWQVRFSDMVSPQYYRRLRTNFFRLHYQFIMTGDRRAAYDYLMLVAGPLAVADWATRRDLVGAFAADGSFAGAADVRMAP